MGTQPTRSFRVSIGAIVVVFAPSPQLVEAGDVPDSDDFRMADEVDSVDRSERESVVLASFESRRAAEHMLASLGSKFRRTARKGHAEALVISENADGSLKLTQSRVLSGSARVAAAGGVTVATLAGFMGIRSAFKGANEQVHAARERESHAGLSAERAREILAQAGPHGAVALVCCEDEQTRQTVAEHAYENARDSWEDSLEEFLVSVDPRQRVRLVAHRSRPAHHDQSVAPAVARGRPIAVRAAAIGPVTLMIRAYVARGDRGCGPRVRGL